MIGFVAIFVLGGLSGVTLASVPFDLQVHDTYYVVAHFHYVLLGGAVFPLIGGIYFWFPKLTGRMMDDRLGKVNVWLLFVGFNITFFPMHQDLHRPRHDHDVPVRRAGDGSDGDPIWCR